MLPKDDWWDSVLLYAQQFTPPNKAAMAVGRIKRVVQSGLEMPFEYGLALERELQSLLFKSRDAKEGLSAYVEKRQPRFQGQLTRGGRRWSTESLPDRLFINGE